MVVSQRPAVANAQSSFLSSLSFGLLQPHHVRQLLIVLFALMVELGATLTLFAATWHTPVPALATSTTESQALVAVERCVVYRPYVTTFAVIVIALGWAIALRRHASVRTLIILGVASALVVAALLIAHHETELTRYLLALRRKFLP